MTNQEAIKIIQMERDHCATHNRDAGKDEEYHKEMQSLVDAYDLAINALKDVERLEEENHENFVKSQHIISVLVEEIKELRGEEE